MSPNPTHERALGNHRYSYAVITDTHLNEAEDRCSSPFDVNRRANRRMRHVVRMLNQRDVAFVINVGDLIHPVPALPDRYAKAADLFNEQIKDLRHPLYLAPGNHDIGDKPNNWAPAAGICEAYIALWEEHFGADYHAFEHGGDRFIVINAQLINSAFAREQTQKVWLEAALAEAAGKRIFFFTHYPPYFSRPDEMENYDNIGEPGRSWLLKLLEDHKVEALLAGHVHNFWFNKYAGTDCYLLPSTSFVRQDYSEMYHARPGPDDEAGRNDRPKLGFAVMHVYDKGHTIEFVRTFGEELADNDDTPLTDKFVPERLHPLTNAQASFGFDMRQNWMEMIEIPPTGGLDEFDRKEVRNDYPLMALWEMGVRNLRVPMRDLLVTDARERMRMLRSQGQEFTLFSFGAPSLMERELILTHQDIFSAWEIAVNWTTFDHEAPAIGEIARQTAMPVYLSRLRSSDELREEAAGRYYHVINQGFLANDEEQMAGILARPELNDAIKGFVFRLTADRNSFDGIDEASHTARRLGVQASVHLRMCGSNPAEVQEDDAWVADRLAEAVVAAAAFDNVSVYADTFVDNDRGYFVRNGVLDRLCNPRPGFHVVRHLTGVLNDRGGSVDHCRAEMLNGSRCIRFDIAGDQLTLTLNSSMGFNPTLRRESGEGCMEIDLVTGGVTTNA
ncbi:MAG: metallophosphoesterase [Proteobacteria bacterium]|nr:metallophosphoesterase [Pseudomonadota bacterium]